MHALTVCGQERIANLVRDLLSRTFNHTFEVEVNGSITWRVVSPTLSHAVEFQRIADCARGMSLAFTECG